MPIVDIHGGKALDLHGELRIYTLYDVFRGLLDIDFPDFFIQFCSAIFVLDAGLTGDTRGHTFEWEIQSGREDNIVYLTDRYQPIVTYEIIALPPAEPNPVYTDRVWRFWIDRGTEVEQFFDLTVYATPTSEVYSPQFISQRDSNLTDYLIQLVKLLTKSFTDDIYAPSVLTQKSSGVNDYLVQLVRLLTKTLTSNVYSGNIARHIGGTPTILNKEGRDTFSYNLQLIKGYSTSFTANGIYGCGANTDYSLHWYANDPTLEFLENPNVYDIKEFLVQSKNGLSDWTTVSTLDSSIRNFDSTSINTSYRVIVVVTYGGTELHIQTNTVWTANAGTIRTDGGQYVHLSDDGLGTPISSQLTCNVFGFEIANLSQGGVGGG